jgi:hypothetical protein
MHKITRTGWILSFERGEVPSRFDFDPDLWLHSLSGPTGSRLDVHLGYSLAIVLALVLLFTVGFCS